MKIHLDKAIALYTLRTGQPYTRKDLADKVLPDSLPSTRQVIIKKYAEGGARRPCPILVWKIADELGVDLNFLYGWNKKQDQ